MAFLSMSCNQQSRRWCQPRLHIVYAFVIGTVSGASILSFVGFVWETMILNKGKSVATEKLKKDKKRQNQVDKKPENKKPEVFAGAKDDLAGLIFMCNSKTNQDCFRYHVFGLLKGQKDVAEKLANGMKLFLYDFELRLMYGIYKDKGRGGLDLEPNAFRSVERTFPAQVKNLCRLFRPIQRDGPVGRDGGIAFLRKEERRVSYDGSVRRPRLPIPTREMAQQYPPLPEDPYPLQASDPYRSAYHRQHFLPYEPPSLEKAVVSDLDYQRELLYDRGPRERILDVSTCLDNIRRVYTPREADYVDSYLLTDPLRSADVYPYSAGPSSIYRY